MLDGDRDFVKEKIEYIKFAILKLPGKSFLPVNRCLVETINVDEEGNIWCSTTESIPKILVSDKEFKVSLRYVHKEEDMFMHITGNAFIEQYSETVSETFSNNKVLFKHAKKVLFKIRISDANYFRKKTLSRYTSVLQSICSFGIKAPWSMVDGKEKKLKVIS